MERKGTFDNPEDVAVILDCIEAGDTKRQIIQKGYSKKKIDEVIKDVQEKKGSLTHYRKVQSLQLVDLQQKVLSYMDDEDKMDRSSLVELASVFNTLKKNELTLDGKPSEIKGLVSYLIEIEKEEEAAATPVEGSIIDVSDEESEEEELPAL